MKHVIAIAFGFLLALSFVALKGADSFVASAADGKALFLAQKCDMCHSVPTAGITAKTKSEKVKGPDIVNLKSDAGTLTKLLMGQGAKKHKAASVPEADMKTLVSWLLAQKR
jgi:cytochrome c551/c552